MEFVHGKWIAVEDLDPETPPKRRRRARLEKTWAPVPHERGIELAKRVGEPAFAVFLVLQHVCFYEKSRRVKLTNDLLQQFGITSQSKTRGLRKLERAGVVHVEWRNKASPMVTHLWFDDEGKLI
jgi:hypothetical protein